MEDSKKKIIKLKNCNNFDDILNIEDIYYDLLILMFPVKHTYVDLSSYVIFDSHFINE